MTATRNVPPVGTVCEFKARPGWADMGWVKCKIIEINKHTVTLEMLEREGIMLFDINDSGIEFREVQTMWDGEGLPPVGAKVESWLMHSGPGHRNWCTMRVTYSHDDVVCGEIIECENGFPPGRVIAHETSIYTFKPFKTQAERDRDELAGIIAGMGNLSEGMLADAIIAAGFTKR